MMVTMRTLTRKLGCASIQVSGVEGHKNARVRDLALDNSPEPLNGTASIPSGLILPCSVEGHSTQTGERVIGRDPVVSAHSKPLIPRRPSKARKLLWKELAEEL